VLERGRDRRSRTSTGRCLRSLPVSSSRRPRLLRGDVAATSR
jgi:hypothetical protein